MGASSNLQKLQKLELLQHSRTKWDGPVPRVMRVRQVRMKEAIIELLRRAGEPVHITDLHAALELSLGVPVSRSSLKSQLSRYVTQAGEVQRARTGFYALAQSSPASVGGAQAVSGAL